MKRIILLLFTTLMLTMLFGCNAEKTEYTEINAAIVEKTDASDEAEADVELVTEEWIMEQFGFSKASLGSYNIPALIKYRQYTEEDLRAYSKEKFIDDVKFFDKKMYTNVGYLLYAGQPREPVQASQIKNIAFVEGVNNSKNFCQICVQDRKAYIVPYYDDNMDLEEDCRYSGALSEEYIDNLLSCLEKANLHEWKETYAGNNRGTAGFWGWGLGIELTDGTVYSWQGYGIAGDNQPEEYQSVQDAVKAVYEDLSIEAEEKLVTREWIVKHFGYSEEELEGIDVDAVIEYCGYTEEDLEDDFFTKEFFLDCLKLYDEDIKTDIGYIFDGGQPEESIPVSQIKTVAFVEDSSDSIEDFWQICVQDKKAYYCYGYSNNMDLEKECYCSGVLTDDYIAELLSCLEKANLHKWKGKYEGNNGETTGDWGWAMGIELTDGSVYTWRGWGIFGNNQPKEFDSVQEIIDSAYSKCPMILNEDNSWYN